MNFGIQLATARKNKALSQEQLGNLIGIDKRIISRYEKGQTLPSIDVAKKMADALHVSLDYLTGLDYSLFIQDEEMTKLLKDYELLNNDDKSTIKRFLKAFSLYSKVEQAQSKLAI
jgi:transcriptional regulator with XRE-family HTH domain